MNSRTLEDYLKQPFIIYVDLETILKPVTGNNDDGPNTKRYQDHIACSYDYKLICVDERYNRP